jgi:hypothetical protein
MEAGILEPALLSGDREMLPVILAKAQIRVPGAYALARGLAVVTLNPCCVYRDLSHLKVTNPF